MVYQTQANPGYQQIINITFSMNKNFIVVFISIFMLATTSNGQSNRPQANIMEETVSYKAGDVVYKGFIAYDANIKGKRPVVLVVPEWWGLTGYAKMRARELAELGYLAFAADLFGDGKIAHNPGEAQDYTSPYYKDPQLTRSALDAAINKIKDYPQADATNIAAIGYCFGGFVVLNAAKLGADLKGVVCFHGSLGGVPADKKLLKAKILVCHGASDKFVSQQDVDGFKHQMDSIGADYSVKAYANATHSFTNPDATRLGKEFNLPIEYNAAADKDSWRDMNIFFNRIFGK
jgi:dienelactone hydrolase